MVGKEGEGIGMRESKEAGVGVVEVRSDGWKECWRVGVRKGRSEDRKDSM